MEIAAVICGNMKLSNTVVCLNLRVSEYHKVFRETE